MQKVNASFAIKTFDGGIKMGTLKNPIAERHQTMEGFLTEWLFFILKAQDNI